MSAAYKAVRLDRTSHYDGATKWRKGSIVRAPAFDHPDAGPCGRGIHCSPTLSDAVGYQQGPSLYCEVEPLTVIAQDATKMRCDAVRVLRWLGPGEQDELAGFRLWEANHPIHPLRAKTRKLDLDALVTDWASVRASVWASVWASVGDSVGDSVWASVGASVRASVGDSVRASVRASVWASVGASVRASVWASVGDSVGDSVWASVWVYTGSLFPAITAWRYINRTDPWSSLRTLWLGGYVPSFDGTMWRLHAGKDAAVVWERPAAELRR